ncbi:hypothetical protein CPB86DRAFT_759594 [Serendipita vermifera]|nr:hypothetical protein CPB86DRAFT_759594 [Serendipita vermifera]
MHPDAWRSVRRITVGSALIIGVGVALMYYQVPRNNEQILERVPAELQLQMRQKKYIKEKYEAEQKPQRPT